MTDAAARALLDALGRRGWTIAVAESLTGGLAVSALIDIPGASAVVRGGVVAYATDVKRSVLGVDADLLGADVGVATTGVAGPEPQDGKPVGTVCIAVVTPEGASSGTSVFTGDRDAIRRASVGAALAACLRAVAS